MEVNTSPSMDLIPSLWQFCWARFKSHAAKSVLTRLLKQKLEEFGVEKFTSKSSISLLHNSVAYLHAQCMQQQKVLSKGKARAEICAQFVDTHCQPERDDSHTPLDRQRMQEIDGNFNPINVLTYINVTNLLSTIILYVCAHRYTVLWPCSQRYPKG